MKRISECLFLWALGGSMYYTFELAFRSYSHWSMFILGGLCMWFCWFQGFSAKWEVPMWRQVIRCALFVTVCEFITGLIVNIQLGWAVWDYTDQPFQILGQVCLPFMIIFSGLCTVGILMSGYLIHWLYREPKPTYYVIWKEY